MYMTESFLRAVITRTAPEEEERRNENLIVTRDC